MPNRKQKTLSFGVFGVRLRSGTGSSLGTFGKSESFEVVLPSGKASKPLKFPKGLRSDQKKLFIQKVLYKILSDQEARREKARELYRAVRERAGKEYKPKTREKPRIERLIGTNKTGLRKIKAEVQRAERREETAPTREVIAEPERFDIHADIKQGRVTTVSDAEWTLRERAFFQWSDKQKSQGEETSIGAVFELSISSAGIPRQGRKDGVKASNWFEDQVNSGLVVKRGDSYIGEHSIWFQVTRYLKTFTKMDWEAVGEGFGLSGTLAFKLALVTNLERHQSILSSVPQTDEELGPDLPTKTDVVRLDLESEDWVKEMSRFQHRVVSLLIHTLYVDPNDYQSNQEAALTSSETYFHLPLTSQSGRGISLKNNRTFKAAFTLLLIPELSS
jgi:hypothetical protein